MYLVVGGTGRLGSVIVRRLLARGTPVRVLTRNPAKGAPLAALGAELVGGDLRDRSSLALACVASPVLWRAPTDSTAEAGTRRTRSTSSGTST